MQILSRKQQESLAVLQQGISKPTYRSLSEAAYYDTKSLSLINKEQGTSVVTTQAVAIRLIDVLNYVGAFEVATEVQISRLAESIVRKYYYMTISELAIFFQMFADGEFGRLYAGKTLNPQDIMIALQMFQEYALEARGRAEDRRREEKERMEKKNHRPISYEEYCRIRGIKKPFPLDSLPEDKSIDKALNRGEIEKYKF